jgi:glycosyltransferase involved in cell wall biosynthesis
MLGDGPIKGECMRRAQGLANVTFEPRLPYFELPARIHQADVLLGIFGTSAKAGRVIPNKVFQALACGRPVITRDANAYPGQLRLQAMSGLLWVPAGNAIELARAVEKLARDPNGISELSLQASVTYGHFFSKAILKDQLRSCLEVVCAS